MLRLLRNVYTFFLQGNGDRAFIKSTTVTGLIKMNKKKSNESSDLHFLRALLIGFYTIKGIKASKTIEVGISSLLKDFFAVRVQKDEQRMRTYEESVNSAINGIRNNLFK